MADDNPPSLRARRWTPPPGTASRSTQQRSYRFIFRLIGIPALAVAAVLLYTGLRDRLVLPACDSERAVKTLSEVLKPMQLEPVRYAPLTTVSAGKDQVVCSAVLPLPGGGSVAIDYTFYWQGNSANMKYSVSRRAS